MEKKDNRAQALKNAINSTIPECEKLISQGLKELHNGCEIGIFTGVPEEELWEQVQRHLDDIDGIAEMVAREDDIPLEELEVLYAAVGESEHRIRVAIQGVKMAMSRNAELIMRLPIAKAALAHIATNLIDDIPVKDLNANMDKIIFALEKIKKDYKESKEQWQKTSNKNDLN